MSRLVISDPALVRLEDFSEQALARVKSFLTYNDRGVDFLIQKHKKKRYWQYNDPEGWQEEFERLKSQRKACILFQDDGGFYTYAGLAKAVSDWMQGVPVENEVMYPVPEGLAWAKEPEHEQRYYQDEIEAALQDAKHAGVEVGTGLGKSRCILELAKHYGLPTLILAPSVSIASQLHADFEEAIGSRYVGLYGDGKKKFDRLITIGLYQSLCRLEPGDPAWEKLSKTEVFMVDESHMCPASTLEKVCMGLAGRAGYRFFFSATQVRNDGSEMVLNGITGPIVYRKTVQEGVDEGFLARPQFRMIRIQSNDTYASDDAQKMTQKYLYYNPDVLRAATEIANAAVKHLKHQVLILVDEIPQFTALHPLFKHEARFAHGGVTKANAGKLLPEFHDSNPQKLVKQYNAGEFPILVGTSCIGTGTDIKACETVINLMGGRSTIAIPQGVGRGTRRFTFADGHKKTAFNFVDFCVQVRNRQYRDGDGEGDMSIVYRHALARAEMYRSLYPSLRWM